MQTSEAAKFSSSRVHDSQEHPFRHSPHFAGGLDSAVSSYFACVFVKDLFRV
jgi:hypothetical protein